jgi:hypothetical protein
MKTILFSIPAHENQAVLDDAIANARKWNGEHHQFIIMANATWSDFDPAQLKTPGVWLNPHRITSKHGNAHIVHHIMNFQVAVANKLEFDYFAVMHTNELFVRQGLTDRITQSDYALWFGPDSQPHEMAWPALRNAYQDRLFKDLFDGSDLHNYLGNLIEGSWWSRELFQEIVDWSMANYSYDQLWFDWAAEECYFPTLAYHLSGRSPFLTPYCAFNHNSHDIMHTEFIDAVRSNSALTFWQPHNFVYQWAPVSTDGIFSVKRIARRMDDPVRSYIRSL